MSSVTSGIILFLAFSGFRSMSFQISIDSKLKHTKWDFKIAKALCTIGSHLRLNYNRCYNMSDTSHSLGETDLIFLKQFQIFNYKRLNSHDELNASHHIKKNDNSRRFHICYSYGFKIKFTILFYLFFNKNSAKKMNYAIPSHRNSSARISWIYQIFSYIFCF